MTAHTDTEATPAPLIHSDEVYASRAQILSVLKAAKVAAWKTGRDGSATESFDEARVHARFEEALDKLVALALGSAS